MARIDTMVAQRRPLQRKTNSAFSRPRDTNATPPSPPPTEMATTSLLSTSLATASSLVLLQLLSRLVTFALNQSLVRLASPAVFGTASIQFELLLSTILFLSREGVRNALMRTPLGGNGPTASSQGNDTPKSIPRHVANISFLPTLLGIPIAFVSTSLYLLNASKTTRAQPYFTTSVLVYALSAILELLSEPLYIRAQTELKFRIRVKAEGTAVIAKAAVTVAVMLVGGEETALLAFAIGQAAYGVVVLASFWKAYPGYLQVWPSVVDERLRENVRWHYFDADLLQLSFAMTSQSLLKHLLTEGDKLVVSKVSSLEDQGGYAVASNYGSLVARIVFQPIEETSRVYFSKTLASETREPPDAAKAKSKSSTESGLPSSDAVGGAFTVLALLVLLHTHLALILSAYLPPYLPLILRILLPQRYHSTSAPQILALYPLLLPVMAFNGILEAFFASASTPESLRLQSRFLVIASISCAGLVWLLVEHYHLVRTGLAWANLANLALRAVWAAWWTRNWFNSRSSEWRSNRLVPPIPVWLCFLVSGVVVRVSSTSVPKTGSYGFKSLGIPDVKHISIGIVCLLGCLGV
ncbi:Oligosaccharide translocation protein rft1, partial [Tulasnella sp. 403]